MHDFRILPFDKHNNTWARLRTILTEFCTSLVEVIVQDHSNYAKTMGLFYNKRAIQLSQRSIKDSNMAAVTSYANHQLNCLCRLVGVGMDEF